MLFIYHFFSSFLALQKNNKDVNLKNININFHSIAFFEEVNQIDTNQISEGVNKLGEKYPDFSSIYFNNLTGFGIQKNYDLFLKSMYHFLTFKDYTDLYDSVKKVFPDTKKSDAALAELFKHIKYYYPNEKWGTVYYFISGLNRYSAVTVDTTLGIGLDMFLGKDYPYYASIGLAQYETEHCIPENIPVLASKVIFEDKWEMNPEGKKLLDLMIYAGKQMTFMEYTLPKSSDELLIGYSKTQLGWCQENEKMIWSFFKKNELLYSSELQKVIRYVMDGPSSTGMPPESPGNIGTYIGWQIVRSYLKNNPEIKWTEIMDSPMDSQTFLTASKYKP
ncbi:MAG: protein involved in gliding motility GldB [Bacteroidetes bacterium OLB11]|nr:MAG: protein involved in gliding motility GldB [Bacteroidetes bacterium OLB11]